MPIMVTCTIMMSPLFISILYISNHNSVPGSLKLLNCHHLCSAFLETLLELLRESQFLDIDRYLMTNEKVNNDCQHKISYAQGS